MKDTKQEQRVTFEPPMRDIVRERLGNNVYNLVERIVVFNAKGGLEATRRPVAKGVSLNVLREHEERWWRERANVPFFDGGAK
jgi:hypothetical protein